MKILIIGFGRMGVSHAFQILGSLGSDTKITVVDPSFLARIISKLLLPQRIYYKNINDVEEKLFDFGVLCTPPYNRSFEVPIISRITKFCLIEKPVLTELPGNAMSGYVMQYCPTVSYVSKLIRQQQLDISAITINVQSNIDFSVGQSGWRSEDKAGGLLYEFFGHALTFGLSPMFYDSSFIFSNIVIKKSQKNVFEACFSVDGVSVRCHIYGDSNVRKTRYSCSYTIDGGSNIDFDPYSVTNKAKVINIPEIVPDIKFFLRAYEFSIQCDRLIAGSRDKMCSKGIRNIENLLGDLV